MFAEDLSVFFNPDEFGVAATIDGRAQTVLFDADYTAALYASVALDASRPAVLCQSALNPAVRAGLSVTVAGVDYIIRATEPDGQGVSGLTRLLLEQTQASPAL